jgi:epoxyqueuosine reductase
MPEAEELAKRLALEAGFDLAGIASLATPPPNLDKLDAWLQAGYHASMIWLSRQRDKRLDPTQLLPGAKSMLCVGLLYNTDHPYSIDEPEQPHISRYAWGDDYHQIMDTKLAALESALKQAFGSGLQTRRYCDTGPVSEKAWAAAAGLGWVGKHSNLINREVGSWIFLGEVLLNLDLQPDPPAPDLCGTCTRCLEACPTQAFPQPGVLDANKCLSYLTIEHRGPIPPAYHAALGLNLYGCDICQEVCPWNRSRLIGPHSAPFEPRPGLQPVDLERLESLDDAGFSAFFKGSAMKRAKRSGLQRNAPLVRQNLSKDPSRRRPNTA